MDLGYGTFYLHDKDTGGGGGAWKGTLKSASPRISNLRNVSVVSTILHGVTYSKLHT
jgi:hypothetical protein